MYYYKFWYFRPNKAIAQLIKGKWISRTDKYVSARENYFYGNIPKVLPKNVILLGEEPINKVLSKEYKYFLPKDKAIEQISYLHKVGNIIVRKTKIKVKGLPNLDLMKEAAKHFIGKKDFTNFTIEREAKNPLCTIIKFDIEERKDYYVFSIVGDRFLYHMVRKIISFIVSVGYKIYPLEYIDLVFKERLNPKPKDADPKFLWLWKINKT
ncbi:NEQ333 [Nanoarchaeum equitans Kin4-M]|uniref:tRNA pseudouridine synthase A n=1 Tax=Nanoarchaeum equitans (strain Kin4-M) TaxID=228908 RepID=TRUA_NANEQ|nr:RecName: Full=tRNA pseudouridine synthase A; AltName: Full=tRNA pseudouridine(38-40) synthase; AltName: Full=tRNA pseudouridylate synthase I; AltName: Full=tRNA-uridine isomerase I [Nanoarchaeum equitans Kin4-M]AAR39182.1 NEQ333 [Nanoarchaeum equitans Kin4-M]